ncbi:MAG: hypothetical protein ACKV0T_19425 [Planctomycetales bacterium]
MMSTKRPPAISGVSSGKAPALIAAVYPSIASTAVGRTLGQIFDCIPQRVCGIRVSHWLILMPLFPLWATIAAAEYFRLKALGEIYALTNQSVQRRTSLGNRFIRETPLAQVEQVAIRQLNGQAFYPAAEIDLLNAAGDTLMTLSGIPRADVFRQLILEARDAHRQVNASLKTIQTRHAG